MPLCSLKQVSSLLRYASRLSSFLMVHSLMDVQSVLTGYSSIPIPELIIIKVPFYISPPKPQFLLTDMGYLSYRWLVLSCQNPHFCCKLNCIFAGVRQILNNVFNFIVSPCPLDVHDWLPGSQISVACSWMWLRVRACQQRVLLIHIWC